MMRISVLLGLAALAAVGCGGGSSNNVGKYVGIWTYSSGTETTTCPDFNPSTDTSQLTGSVTITAGSSADLVTSDNTACVLKFDLDKSGVAQVLPGQSCPSTISFADGSTGTLTLTPQTWMLSMSSPTVLSSSGSGTASVQTGGAIYPCMFSVTSVLSKQ
jgi:hypothetical protein